MSTSVINKKDNKDARSMLIRQGITIPLRFARILVVLPILPPSVIFTIKVITTWFGYLSRIHFGSNAVLSFYYPQAKERGEELKCNQYVNLAWSFAKFGSLIGGLVGIAIAVFYLDVSYLPVLLIWGSLIAPYSYITSNFQARGQFQELAFNQVASAIANFVLPLIGWFIGGIYGYLSGLVLSMTIVVWLGRKMLFPFKVRLEKSFVKGQIFSGLHLWTNGFLSDFVKTYEVTIFVILAAVDSDFSGKYAVAMTLTATVDQVITSISSVFQRKLVVVLAKAMGKPEQKLIFNFVALDLLIFLIMTSLALVGIYFIIFFVPKYGVLVTILPFLLLGKYLLRLRFYPGVAFKSERKFGILHLGHLIHLILGVVALALIVQWKFGRDIISINQVIGAVGGSAILWVGFIRKIGFFPNQVVLGKLFLQLVVVSIWLTSCFYFANDVLMNLVCVIGGGIFSCLLCVMLFPEAMRLLINIFKGTPNKMSP